MEDWGMEMEALEAERYEADCEMAEMTRIGNALARLEKKGVCSHGHWQTRTADNAAMCSPALAAAAVGTVECLKCGLLFGSEASHWEAHEDIMDMVR
jgi:hypothetical protein